ASSRSAASSIQNPPMCSLVLVSCGLFPVACFRWLVSCSLRNRSSSFCCPIVVGETENRQLSQFLFQLPNPLLQKLPLRFLLSQRQSFLIRGPSLSFPAEPAVHICTGGMRQVSIGQFAMFQHRVDMRQTGLWTRAHCNGHGTIYIYNWRRLNSYKL